MPDVYKRRFAIKGTKKDVMKALRFMAEQAALKKEYSYLYEMFLKPTEVGKAGEPYGLTENFRFFFLRIYGAPMVSGFGV